MLAVQLGWHFPDFAIGHAGTPPEFSGTHGAGTVPLSEDDLVASTLRD